MPSSRSAAVSLIMIFLVIGVCPTRTYASEPTKPYIKNLHDVINSKHYPKKLKENPIEGKVIVSIWLDDNGEILKYTIDEANNKALEEFIRGRVPLLQFEPARDNFGVRIFSKVKLPFEFKKEE